MAFEKNVLTPEQQAALLGEDLASEFPSLLPEEDDNLEMVMNEDGSADFMESPEEEMMEPEDEFADNLVEYMDQRDLDRIGTEILDMVESDKETCKEWETILTDGVKLLGLKMEDVTEPFPGASAVTHPILMESITKFHAKAFGELVPPRGPVRTQIIGSMTPEKEAQSRRVRDYMNYQIMHEMPEYVPETDQMLFYLGLAGSAFKKTYYDPVLQRPVSRFIRAEDFYIDYNASDLQTAERYAHKIEMSHNEFMRSVDAGMYIEASAMQMGDPEQTEAREEVDDIEGRGGPTEYDEVHTLYEVHLNYDLGGADTRTRPDRAAPYVVTIDDSGKVLSIRRNWREEDRTQQKRIWFTHYKFIPGLGFHGYGYIHLIGGLAKMATSTMRQLNDAGTFANLPAGFKARGLRVVGDNDPLQPGEWRDVNAAGLDISKSLVPLPFKEPSATLFNLLTFVVEAGQKFADATEQVIADSTNYGPVGTTMALLEASGKLFSAIHKRLHNSQMLELKILARINAESLPDVYPYDVVGASREVRAQDFDDRIDIIPVSDPNMPSRSHRVAKAQALHQTALQFPQIHNMKAIHQEIYAALDYEDPNKFLIPDPPPPQPMDPIAENMIALQGMPVATAEWQDHEAHIGVHTKFMADPNYQTNQQAMLTLQAHLQEHLAHQYRLDMQEQLGVPLPPLEQSNQLPPEAQNEIARRASQVADAILEEHQLQMTAAELAQAAQDPAIQLQQQEIALREMEAYQRYDIETQKLSLEREKMVISDENEDLDREVELYKIDKQEATKKKVAAMKPKPAPAAKK